MKLTKKAIDLIDNKDGRLELMRALDCGEMTVRRAIIANKINGPLTKLVARDAIRFFTGLSDKAIYEAQTKKKRSSSFTI